MHTAYKIDILARTGILLLFPVGFHMGNIYGIQPFGGVWLWANWLFFGVWLAIRPSVNLSVRVMAVCGKL